MAVFRGNYQAKVDDKGRLKFPSDFKDLLDADKVTQFYITSEDGVCAQIWPLPEWEKVEQRLIRHSRNAAVRKLVAQTSSYGQQVEIDGQARVLLPQKLRGKARLEAEVEIYGRLTHLEVFNREISEQSLLAQELTEEDRVALEEILTPKDED